jgi:hypothetical protein
VSYVKIFTKELLQKVPKLYETEDDPDPRVYVKLFFPSFQWTWYVTEFDGQDVCFGYVDGDFPELGYFSLKELVETRDKLGMPIERDRSFRPCRLSELKARIER